jgi:hypothetical protein
MVELQKAEGCILLADIAKSNVFQVSVTCGGMSNKDKKLFPFFTPRQLNW